VRSSPPPGLPGGPGGPAGRPGLRRDRHGRGLRGPLAPAPVPLARSRSERFDDLVLDAVERLERRWADQLSGVEFAVEDVPPADAEQWSAEPVPLGRLLPASGGLPARIVVYRRPLEARAGRAELGALVHDVVVEEVAEFLGLEPEAVDPDYDEPGDEER
jgi:predicted Zn-dependent protease with MMP-like domain